MIPNIWYYPSANFIILGKTILKDILRKCFSKYAYFGWINLDAPSCFIVYNTFFTPYHAILQYSIPDVFPVLYGEYSTDFCFDPPTQSSLNIYIIYMYENIQCVSVQQMWWPHEAQNLLFLLIKL